MTQHGLDLRGHLYAGLPAAALLDNAPHLRRYIQALLELVGKLALVLGSQQSLCHEDAAKGKKKCLGLWMTWAGSLWYKRAGVEPL